MVWSTLPCLYCSSFAISKDQVKGFISHLQQVVRRWNFDSMLLTTQELHMQKFYVRVWNKFFALYNTLKSHLSHKRMWQQFPQRRNAHDDTKNMWDMSSHFWNKLTGIAEISAFFLTFFALAGVKILHLDENWICRCTIPHFGKQNGARIKSIPCTVSDLRRQEKQSTSYYDVDYYERPDSFYFFWSANISEAVIATRKKSINGMEQMIWSFFV